MDIASPAGGFVPLDPESLLQPVLKQGNTDQRYADRTFMNLLNDALKIEDVSAGDYDAIYLTGGHGVCFDFVDNAPLSRLIARFYEDGKIVSAVCHGPAGLLNVDLSDGEPLIKGKKLTGFSWKEEVKADRNDAVPFNLEEELKARGAEYSKAMFAFGEHVVRDGQLITGQNPGSAQGVGEAVIKAIKRA